jgi:hypothetical protein
MKNAFDALIGRLKIIISEPEYVYHNFPKWNVKMNSQEHQRIVRKKN